MFNKNSHGQAAQKAVQYNGKEHAMVRKIARAFDLPVEKVLKASGIESNIAIKKVIHQFEYHIELDGLLYTVISSKDITNPYIPTRFSSEYFDNQNNIVYNDIITQALHREIMNLVREHHELKNANIKESKRACYGQGGL